jgi:SAM-dependent methyltransferase
MNYLESLTMKTSPIRVLHNAPEMGIAKGLNFYNNSSVDYVGFDYYVGPLVYKTSLNEFWFDLANMPFPDEYFHMVITSHVLEHVPSLNASISELYRVLKPGGVGFIAFPANFKLAKSIEDEGLPMSQEERRRKFGQADHVRWIGRDIPIEISRVHMGHE